MISIVSRSVKTGDPQGTKSVWQWTCYQRHCLLQDDAFKSLIFFLPSHTNYPSYASSLLLLLRSLPLPSTSHNPEVRVLSRLALCYLKRATSISRSKMAVLATLIKPTFHNRERKGKAEHTHISTILGALTRSNAKNFNLFFLAT